MARECANCKRNFLQKDAAISKVSVAAVAAALDFAECEAFRVAHRL
jgi:hypothetical protein